MCEIHTNVFLFFFAYCCCFDEGDGMESEADDSAPGQLNHFIIDSQIMAQRQTELFFIAQKLSHLETVFQYFTESLEQLQECWEGLLVEFNTKLENYANKFKSPLRLKREFLELFLMGYCRPEFQMFLTGEYSDKSLRKMRSSIEHGFSRMVKILVKQLGVAGRSMLFILSHLKGYASMSHKHGRLMSEDNSVTQAFANVGVLLVKVAEVERYIHTSSQEYAAFLRFMNVSHLRLSSLHVPSELNRTTNHDNTVVHAFINKMKTIDIETYKGTERKFELENLTQYFKNEDITAPVDTSTNPYCELLTELGDCAANPVFIPYRKTTSLIQEYNTLCESLKLVNSSCTNFAESLIVKEKVNLFVDVKDSAVISQSSYSEQNSMSLALIPEPSSDYFRFYQWDSECYFKNSSFDCRHRDFIFRNSILLDDTFDSSKERLNVISTKLYDNDTLSVLLECSDGTKGILVQVPLDSLRIHLENSSGNCEPVDLSNEAEAMKQITIESPVNDVEVSGKRKVAIVLANQKRSILLFDMDYEEDDELDTTT